MKQLMLQKFADKTAKIGIVGLGYVGLPLMLRYADIGYTVLGFDIDADKVAQLNQGTSYIEHIPAHKIAAACQAGFEATTDFSRISEVEAIILCVPTPLNKYREPDISFVIQTTDAVKQASHSEPAHFDTACTIVRVVFTAACAVYTALIMLALVVVSRPNVPAMRGISPAESIKPRPNSAWSLNTMSPAMRIVACKNAVRHNPMICLHHWMKPSV